MSPRRRTLCFVLIFISSNDGFVASLPVGPVLTEYCTSTSPGSPPQLVNSLSTVITGNRVLPECPQKAFPTQRFNKVFSFGSYPPSINTATTNYGVPKPNSFTTYSTYAPVEISIPLPIVEPITEALAYPADIDSVNIIKNYPPVTQTIQVEGFAPTANVAEIYQTPITVQIPSMPQLPSFVGVASPLPEILPSQNIIQEVYTTNVVPEICPQTEIATVTSVPVETTALNIPSCDVGCGFSGPQLPVTLQINMASPSFPAPMMAVISQPAPSPYSSFNPSLEMPPAPIIVMEKSKSKLKSILPILMLSLFDGGCGNSGGGSCSCSQCCAPTPIPFPIVIPTNNPVITRGRKGKGKASTDTTKLTRCTKVEVYFDEENNSKM